MRIKCIVTYDGTHFYGWQIQPDKRTVQEEIQKAIYKITHEEVTIHSSGRTDAGVHAVGQVFHFDINKEIPEKQWIRALNNFLPDDIYMNPFMHAIVQRRKNIVILFLQSLIIQ